MNLYFTRHGESEANINKVFSNQGFMHFLTNNGITQAENLSTRLKSVNIEYIYTSPVLRAIQTAEIISKKLEIKSFKVHEYLREYNVGILEGSSDKKSWDLYFENEKKWLNTKNHNEKLDRGESFAEIQLRFQVFYNELINTNELLGKNVLIISHGGLLKVGIPKVTQNIDFKFTMDNPIRNCDLVICKKIDNNLICTRWGDVLVK
jgi:Fructose-2,6-bisphosphatase